MNSTDAQLLEAIERYEDRSRHDNDLINERSEAIKYYRGDNTNAAEEGRSQYVSRDCYDVVETIKPQLLKLFLSGDEVVRFEPVGPEDVQAAKIESEYINHIALQKNDAFELFSGWIHDGLIQKNGYALAYYDDSEEIERERYIGLSDEELAMLAQADDVEIVEHEATETGHSVTLETVRPSGCVRYLNIAPENVRVDSEHTGVSLKECDFVEYRQRRTLSQLRNDGFKVADDIQDGDETDGDWEADVRRENRLDDDDPVDPAMRMVTVRYVWVRTSLYSGGKRAELRRAVVVGDTFLENVECEEVTLVAWSPHPLPHQHVGMSEIDVTLDIQDVKTASTRSMLDGMYLSLNGRNAIDEDRVNLDDMLVSRPGGIVRVSGDPGSAIFPLTMPSTQNVALQSLEYFDQVREARTGITRYTSGLDPNSLNKTATGIMQLQAASMQRIELIARHFAEAVKELFRLTHALTLRHGRKAEMVRLTNKWVPIDPRAWKRRSDMTISVGLGTGNRQEQNMFLMQMLQLAMGPGMQMGLSDPSKLYAMLAKLTNNAGFKAAEEFWTDPSSQPPKQQPPDPKLMIEMEKLKVDQAGLQQKGQEMQVDAQQEQAKLMADAQTERMRLQQAQQEAVLRAEVEMQKAQLQAETQLRIARMNAYTTRQSAAATRLSAAKVKRNELQ